MRDAIEMNRESFISNWKGNHGHTYQVKSMSMSTNGRYLVTVTNDEVKCWKVVQCQAASVFVTIPLGETQVEGKQPHACISDDGQTVIVNRGDLMFTFYNIANVTPTKQDTLDVLKEIKVNGNPGFVPYTGDQVTDLRLIG
jgi:hypothetical protein